MIFGSMGVCMVGLVGDVALVDGLRRVDCVALGWRVASVEKRNGMGVEAHVGERGWNVCGVVRRDQYQGVPGGWENQPWGCWGFQGERGSGCAGGVARMVRAWRAWRGVAA